LNKIIKEQNFGKKKELVKNFFENLEIFDTINGKNIIKFKPCSNSPFELMKKPYFKNGVLLPFKDNEFLSQYLIFSKESEQENNYKNIQTTTTETPKVNKIKKIQKKNENLNIENNNFKIEISENENLSIIDIVKVILGVSGSGKTHHIINKIYENKNNYLIYMSCSGANIENKQFADYCTQNFIRKCESFEQKLSEYKIIEKRKIMVNFIFYYFLFRFLIVFYEKEILNWDNEKILFSQLNGNSKTLENAFDKICTDEIKIFENFDIDKFKNFFILSGKDDKLIFALDESQILDYYLINKFCSFSSQDKNKQNKIDDNCRSLLSVFSESLQYIQFVLKYLLGTCKKKNKKNKLKKIKNKKN
jgi:hypothetical protein